MRLFRRPEYGGLLVLLLLIILEYFSSAVNSITITTVYAGKKKFRSYNLGVSFLPTLVKVKPNRFALSFRRSRYIRPPKFNIEGSLPLKVPTIIMERPDPYAPPQIININKDIKLGQDEDYGGGGDYKAASEEKPTSTNPAEDSPAPDLSSAASEGLPVPTDDRVPPEDQWAAPPSPQQMPFYPPPPPPPHFLPHSPIPFSPMFPPLSSSEAAALPYPPPPPPPPFHLMSHPPSIIDPMFMARSQQQQPEEPQQSPNHRTRRSLNLNEPYHHHLGDHAQQHLRVRRMPHEYPSSASVYPPPPPHPPLPFSYPQFNHHLPPPPSSMYNYHPYYHHPQPNYHQSALAPPPFGATFLPPPPPPPPMWSSPPPAMYNSYHQPLQTSTIAKQDTIAPEAQQFVVNEVPVETGFSGTNSAPVILQQQQPKNFEIPVDYSVQKEVSSGNQQPQPMPMKINIGEHYNPNAVYMDESIIPSMEDAPLISETIPVEEAESLGEESSYDGQYLQRPSYSGAGGYPKDTGPDDFRINFSFSGVHGGPLVPLGTGDNIEQYYKALKKFKGNNLPVGLPPEQLYRYYRAHTFTDGIRVYRLRPTKIVKAKLIKALFG